MVIDFSVFPFHPPSGGFHSSKMDFILKGFRPPKADITEKAFDVSSNAFLALLR